MEPLLCRYSVLAVGVTRDQNDVGRQSGIFHAIGAREGTSSLRPAAHVAITNAIPHDRARVMVCELTDKGRRVAKEADRLVLKIEDGLRAEFTEGELEQFQYLMKKTEDWLYAQRDGKV